MKASSVLFLLVALFGLLAAYLLYEPVPDGITEPAKYRSFRAISKLIELLISVSHLAHRDEPFASYYVRYLRYIADKGSPKPQAEVEGSNIRSRVIDLGGVNARLYEPIKRSSSELMPALIYIHGGGMCIGSVDFYDGLTRNLAEDLNIVVVSIDYRLAPEHPFPVGHEDCLTATRFFMQHAEKDFHVDQRRIGIGGESAGGHLSASVANDIHDDPSLPDLKLQVLIYPSMQKIDLNTPSYQKYAADFGEAGILPLPLVITFMSLANLGKIDPELVTNAAINNHTSSEFKKTSLEYKYVDHDQIPAEYRDPRYYKTRNDPQTGNAALWERISPTILDPRSAPLMRRDLSGLPPAYIITCGFDSLRDDGIFYKNRLEEAGVRVQWSHYEDAFHGVLWMGGQIRFTLGDKMRKEIVTYVTENI